MKRRYVILCSLLCLGFVLYPTKEREWKEWTKYEKNPVLGDEETGTLFDPFVMIDQNGNYRMYVSNRKENSIVLFVGTQKKEEIEWSKPITVLKANNQRTWDKVNRASVLYQDGMYHMWYTGQTDEKSSICYATSKDGVHFETYQHPVLVADSPYEKENVMNPHVLYDKRKKQYQMYYAAGDYIEPDVICYATSQDGIHFQKYQGNPILEPSYEEGTLDSYKVGGMYVLRYKGESILFYIGYTDLHTGRILMATSKNGIDNWTRYNTKAVLEPSIDQFDADAIYKPSVIYDKQNQRWLLWYNGRNQQQEYIGMGILSSKELR